MKLVKEFQLVRCWGVGVLPVTRISSVPGIWVGGSDMSFNEFRQVARIPKKAKNCFVSSTNTK